MRLLIGLGLLYGAYRVVTKWRDDVREGERLAAYRERLRQAQVTAPTYED